MGADINMKQGDLEPSIAIALTDTNGPVDVSSAEAIKFRMAPITTRAELFNRDASVDDAANGFLSYAWQLGDTDIVGTYYAEFVVTWPGTRPQTFPSDGYITIAIEPRL